MKPLVKKLLKVPAFLPKNNFTRNLRTLDFLNLDLRTLEPLIKDIFDFGSYEFGLMTLFRNV